MDLSVRVEKVSFLLNQDLELGDLKHSLILPHVVHPVQWNPYKPRTNCSRFYIIIISPKCIISIRIFQAEALDLGAKTRAVYSIQHYTSIRPMPLPPLFQKKNK